YLRNRLGFDPETCGLIIMIYYGAFTFSAVIYGILWQKGFFYSLMTASMIFAATSFLLQGPASFISFEPHIGFSIGAQVLAGFSGAGQAFCGIAGAIKIATDKGFPDDLKTSSIVTGWGYTAMMIGQIVTPSYAATVVDKF